MNRSILIVICDFLLVSLLVFSTADISKLSTAGTPQPIKMEIATNQVESGRDLTAVMRQALEEEKKNRDQLLGELTKAREAASQQQSLAQNFQHELQSRDEQARQLQEQQTSLQQQFAAAQTNLQTLNQQLQTRAAEADTSKEKLSAMEAELRRQNDDAAALKEQLANLSKSNQFVLAEKQRLAGQLQVAEVERRHAAELAERMEKQVEVERQEKAKLAEGVKALATNSQALASEIRENRPLAPNTIFDEFLTNRVEAAFNASRTGAFGFDSSRTKQTETILVTDGTNTFALCHVGDTPLTLWSPGTDWESLTGSLAHNVTQVPITSLSFHSEDPRVVFMPVSTEQVRELGAKVYRVSASPYKFQDAVLIGGQETYYGQCSFEIDPTAPNYVKLDRNLLKGLFGKFNPSRGDLVFSKNGELLGIMANSTYCLMIRDFTPTATVQFGQNVRNQRTGIILSQLYSTVVQFPFKLQ